MFGFLKDKLKKAVQSISEKFEKKEPMVEKPEVERVEEVKPVEIIKPAEKIEEEISVEEKIEEEVAEKFEPEMEAEPEAEIEKEKIVELVKIEKVAEKPKEEKKGFFRRITEKIVKKVVEKKLSREDVGPILNELENGLIESDVAYDVAEKIKNDLEKSLVDRPIKRGKEKEIVISALRQSLLDILTVPEVDLEEMIKKAKGENRPVVLLFFGMNGVGKSLNLSKVANFLKNKGYRTILAAGDTYRAGGSIQLEMYGEKIDTPVIAHERGSDSCAVIFDAISAAKARGYDAVLGDTSGRMHTEKNLMNELEKIVRVNKPDLKILVLDGTSGSDVLSQFEFFDKAVCVDAIIFSKMDVNEKGGNILSICHAFKKPILFLGVGQKYEDLKEYSPSYIINELIS